jgi:hypothetical protein
MRNKPEPIRETIMTGIIALAFGLWLFIVSTAIGVLMGF